MAFGKPGRPPEDRLWRQQEIFGAIGPLLIERGPRRLSMQEAARAVCISIGGLYHYFPNKRELVLFGLRSVVLERRCREFHFRNDHLAASDPRGYLDAFTAFSVGQLLFARPAVHAAIELGSETLWPTLEAGLSANRTEFLRAVRGVAPDLEAGELEAFGRTLRRMALGALFDRSIDVDEYRAGLKALVVGVRGMGAVEPGALTVVRSSLPCLADMGGRRGEAVVDQVAGGFRGSSACASPLPVAEGRVSGLSTCEGGI